MYMKMNKIDILFDMICLPINVQWILNLTDLMRALLRHALVSGYYLGGGFGPNLAVYLEYENKLMHLLMLFSPVFLRGEGGTQ